MPTHSPPTAQVEQLRKNGRCLIPPLGPNGRIAQPKVGDPTRLCEQRQSAFYERAGEYTHGKYLGFGVVVPARWLKARKVGGLYLTLWPGVKESILFLSVTIARERTYLVTRMAWEMTRDCNEYGPRLKRNYSEEVRLLGYSGPSGRGDKSHRVVIHSS